MKDLGERAARSSAELGPSVFSKRRTPGGALSAYVEQKGLGPFGFSVSVADLKTAQRVVEQGTNRKFATRKLASRSSFMVPAAFIGGTSIEFVQQEAQEWH